MSSPLELDVESFARNMGVASLHECLRELHYGVHARQVVAHFRQAAHGRAMEGAVGIEGIGQADMVIDASAFHYWGQREGYECWDDAGFCREFKRDNPDSRVKGAARKTTIVNQWGRPATGEGGE